MARVFDITEEFSFAQLIDSTRKEFGGLDGLFNVAADLSVQNIGRDSDVGGGVIVRPLTMNELAKLAINAHGGLHRWKR